MYSTKYRVSSMTLLFYKVPSVVLYIHSKQSLTFFRDADRLSLLRGEGVGKAVKPFLGLGQTALC